MSDIYLHIGCGLVAPDTWVNIDASWNAQLAKYPLLRKALASLKVIPEEAADVPWPRNILIRNVLKGLPHSDNSVSAIYASHFLEHLPRRDALAFLGECYRVLRPGGIIRLVVPDLESLAVEYVSSKGRAGGGDTGSADRFVEGLGVIKDFKNLPLPSRLYLMWKGSDLHRWLYDFDSLAHLLREARFKRIERKSYLDSGISRIRDVEREERLSNAVCVEAER